MLIITILKRLTDLDVTNPIKLHEWSNEALSGMTRKYRFLFCKLI